MSSGTPPTPTTKSNATRSSPAADAGRIWTPKSLLEWTAGWFGTKGIATPRLDAELLLAHVLGLKRLDLYLQFDRPLGATELAAYRDLVRKRVDRVPVAYLVGEVGFWSLTLDIAPGCLIPRPDTEALVEAVITAIADLRGEKPKIRDEKYSSPITAEESAPESGAASEATVAPLVIPAIAPAFPAPLTVLELGTGSAAIPLAVCSETRAITWIAVERSLEALAVARRNVHRHEALLEPRGNRLELVQGDGFADQHAGSLVDLIVSNPPYIRSGEIAALMPEVSAHEPRGALDGGEDGLAFYRLLIAEAVKRLRPGGRLIVEIGHDQLADVEALVAGTAGLSVAGTRRDLAGHSRVVDVRRD